jgi:hypothetical protein
MTPPRSVAVHDGNASVVTAQSAQLAQRKKPRLIMTDMNWVRTQANMEWILGTFDRLLEALRSAPTDLTKSAMLSIIGEFGSRLQIPNRQRTAEPIPNEHKTLIDDWEKSQDVFEQWMTLSRMRTLLNTFESLVIALQAKPYKENDRIFRGARRELSFRMVADRKFERRSGVWPCG